MAGAVYTVRSFFAAGFKAYIQDDIHHAVLMPLLVLMLITHSIESFNVALSSWHRKRSSYQPRFLMAKFVL